MYRNSYEGLEQELRESYCYRRQDVPYWMDMDMETDEERELREAEEEQYLDWCREQEWVQEMEALDRARNGAA